MLTDFKGGQNFSYHIWTYGVQAYITCLPVTIREYSDETNECSHQAYICTRT